MGPRVFLSHAGDETEAAQELAHHLKTAGIDVWVDVERLKPGQRWMEEIENALREASAFVIYIGAGGVRDWVDNEVRVALDLSTKDRSFRLIPALGPGADPDSLPLFLKQHQWIDLREGMVSSGKLKDLLDSVGSRPAEGGSVLPQGMAPFRGLLHFDVHDALLFYGREQETEEILDRLRVDDFLAVVGSSGSGKSSLVRAGLIPALHRGRFHDGKAWAPSWRVAVLRPGESPFDELLKALPDLKPEMSPGDGASFLGRARDLLHEGSHGLADAVSILVPRGTHTLLVVDQFEELFTITNKPAECAAFVDALLTAAKARGERPVHLIVTLRADFYSSCWRYPELVSRMDKSQFLVKRLGSDQLREVIERPLALAGARAESGLVDALLNDVGEEPGNLPLLEHALLQLWERRQHHMLTHQGYEEIGRLSGALENYANDVYDNLEGDDEKEIARRLFLSLTQLGEGAEDTRRRAKKTDLLALGEMAERTAAVLDALTDARLVTTSGEDASRGSREEVVEVAHESLIREWPLLRAWLDQNRESLRLERRITRAAEEWGELGGDPSMLLRGTRLAEAEEWASQHKDDLPFEACRFLETSIRERDVEIDKERERQQAELETARKLAAAEQKAAAEATQREQDALRLSKRTTTLSFVLALLVLVSGAIAYWGYVGQRKAERALSRSDLNEASRLLDADRVAEALAYLARGLRSDPDSVVARSLAINILLNRSWPRPLLTMHTAPLISAEFSRDGTYVLTASVANPSRDVLARTWDAVTGEAVSQPMLNENPSGDDEYCARFSPDGQRILTVAGNTAKVWDAATSQPLGEPMRHGDGIHSAWFSPDGTRIVTASGEGGAQVWDANTGEAVGEPMNDASHLLSARFSPSGGRIVTASPDGTARVWDTATGQALGEPMHHSNSIRSAEFSPDGKRIVTAGWDRTARVWDAATGQALGEPMRHEDSVDSAEFSPDGNHVLTVDGTARVWDAATGQALGEPMRHEEIGRAEFSPDGKRVVTVSWDSTAQLWDAATGEALGNPISHRGRLSSARFSPDGKRIVTASIDGTVRVWDATPDQALETTMRHGGAVNSVQFSPDSKRVVTASMDRTAQVWDGATGRALGKPMRHGGGVDSAQFSPAGGRVLTVALDTVQVWDTGTNEVLGGSAWHAAAVLLARFGPDGRRFLTVSSKTVQVWDATTIEKLGGPMHHDDTVRSAQFSPDGRSVVTAAGNTVQVWDASSGQTLGEPMHHDDTVRFVQFGVDGRRILIAASDTARVWDVATGGAKGVPMAHDGWYVGSAQFSRDGKRILTAASETARVWDAGTGQALGEPMRHDVGLIAAQFGPDGERIFTACWDGRAQVWDAATGQALGEPMRHDGDGLQVRSAHFSPDGKRIVTASADGAVRVWDAFAGVAAEADLLASLAEYVGGYEVTELSAMNELRDPPKRLAQLRQDVPGSEEPDGSISSLVAWFLADRFARTISPLSKVTVPEYIQRRIEDEAAKEDLLEQFPGHPLLTQAEP